MRQQQAAFTGTNPTDILPYLQERYVRTFCDLTDGVQQSQEVVAKHRALSSDGECDMHDYQQVSAGQTPGTDDFLRVWEKSSY